MRRRLRNSRFETLNVFAAICAALFLLLAATGHAAERVKDLASVQGVRNNQLVGYGLVVGLDGTGDQTSQAPFTIQSIKNMLVRFGVTIPPNTNPQLKNVAAVTVHADLPPFAKPGQNIDITVSSIGNAGSLRGGSLIMTPLRGADGQVYAMAQGSLVVGGFGVSGKDGSRIAVNVPSAGRVPNGATVEREVPTGFSAEPYVILNLHVPDFTTSARLVEGINSLLGDATAQADGRRLRQGRRARGSEPAHRVSVDARADRDRAGRRAGARHRQFPHRHGGHRLARARDAGGRGARFAVGDDHRARLGEPAE